ncbi:MAG TPA: alpha-L-arabinofuranosidase C-terminal domain-containing protein [Verrucomicrobiae bacterium]|nr:alpha-L-arabinofuranosidase C-terminal domain-containing protein [Verrucomicrobiae bacterium]
MLKKSNRTITALAILSFLPLPGWAQQATITVHADEPQHRLSPLLTGACLEDVNHEVYGGIDSQMINGESFAEAALPPSQNLPNNWSDGVSGMWRDLRRGTAKGQFSLDEQSPFAGHQSQRITFDTGTGELGIENESLNRWGMNFVKHKTYEGYIWARATLPIDVFVALESHDGASLYAEKRCYLDKGDWKRIDFTLTPNAMDKAGRFAIKLKQPGTITIGYVLLQPGPWGRFKNLPVRKDVARGLVNQGITVLRYGGSMVNASEYRWKNMIGPRAFRPPYAGTWRPHSSDGWGIFEFLSFCQAAGFVAVPDINVNETPQDMADFIDYANGSTDTIWGHKRAENGHPAPYHLKYLELGNEETVNENYWWKFKPIAESIWARDPFIVLVVGDFSYHHPIQDPFNFSGADSRITTLAAHQKILQLARQHNREVWFDVHVGTDGPRPDFGGTLSYIDALDKLSNGAKHHVVIFEFNAGNHSQRRALANAAAINTVERDGRLPIATSANCLQPDGQNDNGWDQGLLFLNPSQVWLQPPGYVTQMLSRNRQPILVKSQVENDGAALDVAATRSEDNKILVLQVVNFNDQPVTAAIHLESFIPRRYAARVETLSGALDARNTAANPQFVKPMLTQWRDDFHEGRATYTFPADSLTVISFK